MTPSYPITGESCAWTNSFASKPLKPIPQLLDFRIRQFAVGLPGKARCIFMNLHAPSGSGKQASERRRLFNLLAGQDLGGLYALIGDWNDTPPQLPGGTVVMPTAMTFRRSSSDEYSTRIDGAVVADTLAHQISCKPAYSLHHEPDSQHRPIIISFDTRPATQDFLRWCKEKPGEERWDMDWQSSTYEQAFLNAISSDIDLAWSLWHAGAGGSDKHCEIKPDAPWGSWSIGARDPLLRKFWKDYGRAAANHDIDKAHSYLQQIAEEIDAAKADRLSAWKSGVSTRSAAAA